MDNSMKINATMVSFQGRDSVEKTDSFYLNGRYRHDYEIGSIQVSSELSSPEYLFSVSSGMDREGTEQRTPLSIARDMAKLQDGFRKHEGELETKLEQVKEHVQEINNIIHTMSLSNPEEAMKSKSFACILMSGGKAAALNMGKSKAYLYRNSNLTQIFSDAKRTDRLYKMGILTDEQARILSGGLNSMPETGNIQLQKSKAFELQSEDLFLLCSENINDFIDEQKISEVLDSKKDTEHIANSIIREALRRGADKCITVIAVRLEKTGSYEKSKPVFSRNFSQKLNNKRDGQNKKKENMGTFVAVLVSSAAIIGVLLMAYLLLFTKGRDDNSLVPVTSQAAQITDQPSTQGTADTTNQDGEKDSQDGSDTDHPKTYTVKSGDTLQGISVKCYGTVNKYKDIMKANNISDPDSISIGQELTIP